MQDLFKILHHPRDHVDQQRSSVPWHTTGKPSRRSSSNIGVGGGSRVSYADADAGSGRNEIHGSCYKESSLILAFISYTLKDTAGMIALFLIDYVCE